MRRGQAPGLLGAGNRLECRRGCRRLTLLPSSARPLLHLLPGLPHLPGLHGELLLPHGPPPGAGHLRHPCALQRLPVSEGGGRLPPGPPPPALTQAPKTLGRPRTLPVSPTAGSRPLSCVVHSGGGCPSGPRSRSPFPGSLSSPGTSSSSWGPKLLLCPFCWSPGEGPRLLFCFCFVLFSD